MVAKRAVQGRSKSYDELLLDWKRENVPGFVEPVKKETKAERKAKKEAEKEKKRLEMLAAGIVPGSKKKAAAAKKAEAAAAAAASGAAEGAAATKTKKSKKSEKTGEKGAGGGGKRANKSSSAHVASKDGIANGGGGGGDDEEDEDYDSEAEYASLVQAVRQARPYTAVPIAAPANMANFFVARNEVLRNCFDTMGFALSGGNIRGGAAVVGTAA